MPVDLVSRLSPTLWDLLQRTRLRSDVALELFDEALSPLLPPSDDPRWSVVRRAASIRFVCGAEVSFKTVLQGGREARLSFEDWDITLLPIRDERQPVGLLAAVTPRPHDEIEAEWVSPAPGEAAARAWRDAVEGDLVSARRQRSQEQLTQRSRALATFVADLQQCGDEDELLKALLQAIAVWHDVEPCAYVRDLAGQFTLRAALPGTDVSVLPATLEAGAVIDATAGRAGEWPILTQLGWRGKGTPLLMLVSSGSLEEWLIALTGPHDSDTNEQLQPMLRAFSTGLERVREREARQLRQQLWTAMASCADPGNTPGLARELLTIVGSAVEATHGALSVSAEEPQEASQGTLVGTEPDTSAVARDAYLTADSLSVAFPLGSGRTAWMQLRRTGRGAFRAADLTVLLAVRPLIGAWLIGLPDAADCNATFGAPDAPRVLRFQDSSTSAWT